MGACLATGLDSDGRDVFMVAILKNNIKILDLLLSLRITGGANYSHQDRF